MNYDAFPLGFIVGIVCTLALVAAGAWLDRRRSRG